MSKHHTFPNHGWVNTRTLAVMCKHVPGFSDLNDRDQYQLCAMVDRSQDGRWEHKRVEGASSFGYKEIDRMFGRNRFDVINKQAKVFDVSLDWSVDREETKAYRLSRHTKLALDWRHKIALRADRECQLKNHNGKTLRTPPPPISSKARSGQSTNIHSDLQIENLTPVNTDNLRQLVRDLQQGLQLFETANGAIEDFPDTEMIPQLGGMTIKAVRHRITFAGKVIGDSKTNLHQDTVLLHQYVETGPGRLFARGAINLQSAPREIRYAALAGLIDYDIENCHFELFYQRAEKAGYPAVTARYYLENKKTIRQELSSSTGCSIDEIKECLIAIMYGAKQTTFASEYYQASIPDCLGEEGAAIFIKHPFVDGLVKELRAGSKAIIAGCKTTNRGNIVNAMGNTICQQEDRNKIMAHLFQGLEVKMLEIAMCTLGKNIVLLQHDGFTCRKPINRNELSKAILDQTGYSVTFSEEILQPSSMPVAV